MTTEAVRIGRYNEDEAEKIGLLSPLERKQALLEAAQTKQMALAINPGYSQPSLREERYYALGQEGNIYWFKSSLRRDDFVSHTGSEAITPTLAEMWRAILWRNGDKWYYAKDAAGNLHRFPTIAKRDEWGGTPVYFLSESEEHAVHE